MREVFNVVIGVLREDTLREKTLNAELSVSASFSCFLTMQLHLLLVD